MIESGVKHQLGYAFVRMDSGDVAEEGTLALHNYAGTPFDFEYRDELPKETTRLRTTLEFFHRPVTKHEDYEVDDEKIDDAVEEKPPREVIQNSLEIGTYTIYKRAFSEFYKTWLNQDDFKYGN